MVLDKSYITLYNIDTVNKQAITKGNKMNDTRNYVGRKYKTKAGKEVQIISINLKASINGEYTVKDLESGSTGDYDCLVIINQIINFWTEI